jgi:FkbM family methyltransferase
MIGTLLNRLPVGRRTALRLAQRGMPSLLGRVITDCGGVLLECDLGMLPDCDYATGNADQAEIAFLLDQIGANGTFIDIGANIGLYAAAVGSKRRDVKVFAVEPVPALAERLRSNLRLNNVSNVVVIEHALAETETTKPLFMNPTNTGGNGFVTPVAPSVSDHILIDVRAQTLLALCQTQGITRIDGIKIDVEGYEYPILRAFFSDAPQALWPQAIVIEEYGQRTPGTSAVEACVRAGYHIAGFSNLNILLVRAHVVSACRPASAMREFQ